MPLFCFYSLAAPGRSRAWLPQLGPNSNQRRGPVRRGACGGPSRVYGVCGDPKRVLRGLWQSQEGFIGLVAKVWASGTAALWGNVCPGQALWALGCEALRRRAGGALGFLFIFIFCCLFPSLPVALLASGEPTSPRRSSRGFFSFTRGLRDGGEHRETLGGSQAAPMASPFTLTPQSGAWTSKTFGFGANITKNISLLSASL